MKLRLIILSFLSVVMAGLASANSGQNAGLKLGIDRGGLVVGGEYEIEDTVTESFLGYLSIASKDEDKGAPGLFAIGAALKLKKRFGSYAVYMAPGFGIVSYDLADRDDLLFGPRLSIGMYALLDANLGVGIENQKLYSWLGEVKGLLSDTFLINFLFSI